LSPPQIPIRKYIGTSELQRTNRTGTNPSTRKRRAPSSEQQQQNVIFLFAFGDVLPGRQRRQHAEERRQHNQQHRDAVSAHLIARADHRNPLMVFEELKPPRRGHTEQPQRDDEVQHQPAGRELLDEVILILFEEPQDQNRADRGSQVMIERRLFVNTSVLVVVSEARP
jgi:hypothetical protein